MKKLTNYIVFHDQESLEWFIMHNPDLWKKFIFIYVGDGTFYYYGLNKQIIIANTCIDNIEQYPSLLTFTAWYLLANNDICKTDYVGIFEYDVVFKEYPSPELKEDTIYGFKQRPLPDGMYLDAIPECKKFLYQDEIYIAEHQEYWNAGSNFIIPKPFLYLFSSWYFDFIFDYGLLEHKKHSHYHERLINFMAANHEYKNKTIDILEHKELNSHGVRL